MNNKKIPLAALVAVALSGLCPAWAQTLISNGDFSSPGVLVFDGDGAAQIHTTPADDAYDFGTGWYATNDEVHLRQSGSLGVVTPDGGNFLTVSNGFRDAYGYPLRTVGRALTVFTPEPNTAYTLSFDATLAYLELATFAVLNWSISVKDTALVAGSGDDGAPGLAWGNWTGNPLFQVVPDDEWTHVEWTFTTPDLGGIYELVFHVQTQGAVTSSNVAGIALDNISIVPTSAVPEPAAFAALAGVGALGCALFRRRRHAA